MAANSKYRFGVYGFVFLICSILLFLNEGCKNSSSTADAVLGSDGQVDSGDTSGNNTGTSQNIALQWEAPGANEDGTPLVDLAGFYLYYGSTAGEYTDVVDVGNVTDYEFQPPEPGPYYITVTAYDFRGNESDFANEVYADVQ